MAVDMDRLLDQDMLAFSPVSGEYDVEALAAGIAGIDYSFRDETRPERFVLAPRADTRDAIAAARRADPGSPFPMQVNVEVHSDVVMVWPATFSPELRALSQRVVEWLLSVTPCRVENDFDADLGGSE